MNAFERRLSSAVADELGFLSSHGFRLSSSDDAQGMTITMTGPDFALEFRLEDDAMSSAFVPLVQGGVPGYFDASGRELLDRVPLDFVLTELSRGLPPEDPIRATKLTPQHQLTRSAGLIRNHLAPFLSSWRDLYQRARERALRESSAWAMEEWASHVERLRRGEPVNEIQLSAAANARRQLGDALDELASEELRAALDPLDRDFERLTKPIGSGRRLMPPSQALKWWREPLDR